MPKNKNRATPPYDSKRSIAVDPRKLRAALDANSATIEEISLRAGISRKTIYDIETRGGGREDTLLRLTKALGISLVAISRDTSYSENAEPSHQLVTPNNWELDGLVSPFIQAANGVTFRVAKLRHSLDTARVARGKFYDLLAVQPQKKEEMQAYLLRHSIVCRLLERSRWTPIHYDVRPLAEDTAWWVLDEWIPWPTLSDLSRAEDLPLSAVKSIGTEILHGMAALHAQGVILRELAPERILVNEKTYECVLTDFELAKLIQGSVTVSGVWKCTSPYRAPEIGDEEPTFQCDIYSWGKVLAELLTGKTEVTIADFKLMGLADRFVARLLSCIKVASDKRPRDIAEVLAFYTTWNPSK